MISWISNNWEWIIGWLDKHSGAGTILSTVVLIGVTIFYAVKAKQQADEAKKSRELQRDVFEHQKEIEIKKNLDDIKNSAQIIYIDLFTAINEIILNANPKYLRVPNKMRINSQYPNYLANLSSVLELGEMILINKLYGMIVNDSELDLFGEKIDRDSPLQVAAFMSIKARLGNELFGDRLICHESKVEARLSNHEVVIEDMEPQYQQVFTKLKNLL